MALRQPLKKRPHVHTANSMMRASGQPADAWAFWLQGSGDVVLEKAEIMFSHKNVNGSWRTFMTITLLFTNFRANGMNNLENPCSIATHKSYIPQRISFI